MFIGLLMMAGGAILAWTQFSRAFTIHTQEQRLKSEGRYADAVGGRVYGGGAGALGALGVFLVIIGFVIMVEA